MKRVSGYQTTDGKIFTTDQKKEAREHQASLNVIAGLTAIGERIDADPSLYNDDFRCNVISNASDFAAFVLANAEDIKKALEGKVVEPAEEPAAPAAETPAAPAGEGDVSDLAQSLGA